MIPHSLLKSRDSLTLSRVWVQGYFEIPARPVPDSRKLPHGQKYANIVRLLPLPGSSLFGMLLSPYSAKEPENIL